MGNSILNQAKDPILYLKHADGLHNKFKLGRYFLKNLAGQLGLGVSFAEEAVVSLAGLTIHFKPAASELSPFKEIFVDGMYQRHPLFKLKDQKIIFDLGANVGLFTLKAAKSVTGCSVYSFEPNPDTFKRLVKNIKANSLNNVFAFQKAIGSENGILKLKKATSSTMSRIGDENGEDLINVEVITLDNIVDEHEIARIDLVKIDVEGGEYEVLVGAANSLSKIKSIVMEYHSHKLLEKVTGLLETHGFDRVLQVWGYAYFLNKKLVS